MEYISEKSACAGRGVSVAAVCALLAFGAAAEGATGVPVPTVPVEGAVIEPLTWGQQLARASDYTVPTTAAFSRYSTPIRLEWTGTTGPAEVSVCRASDGHCIWQSTSASGSCDVYNFYVGEEHVWTVRTDDASATGRFTVAQMAPRIIYTHNDGECFSNMRDEGGYRVWTDGASARASSTAPASSTRSPSAARAAACRVWTRSACST